MTGLVVVGMANEATATPLDALRWRHRLLLVFAQDDAERVRRQRDALPDHALRERDLLVIVVPKMGEIRLPGVGTYRSATIRSAYGIAETSPFAVVLVGKDGGVKHRSSEPIAARELFGIIDAMPMRRQEMRGG